MDPDDVTAQLRATAIELNAISESALAYCEDQFDIERFHRIGAISRELTALLANGPLPEYNRELASVAGYVTPKLDVRAGVFDDDGRVLLVREIADEHRWTLPGGWCDVLESARTAVEREVREEAGAVVRATQLAAVLDRELWPHEPPFDRHTYKLLFVCELEDDVDTGFTSNETSEVGWFDVDDLPELSISRILPEQIKLLHEHWLQPGPAQFD